MTPQEFKRRIEKALNIKGEVTINLRTKDEPGLDRYITGASTAEELWTTVLLGGKTYNVRANKAKYSSFTGVAMHILNQEQDAIRHINNKTKEEREEFFKTFN